MERKILILILLIDCRWKNTIYQGGLTAIILPVLITVITELLFIEASLITGSESYNRFETSQVFDNVIL